MHTMSKVLGIFLRNVYERKSHFRLFSFAPIPDIFQICRRHLRSSRNSNQPPMIKKTIHIILLALNILPLSAYARELPAQVQDQIGHLLVFIADSECKFMRNGNWYDSSEAAKHIKRKFEYVRDKGLVNSAEDFVQYSATKSSLSGRKYRVKCGDGPEMNSSDWLQVELSRYRFAQKEK